MIKSKVKATIIYRFSSGYIHYSWQCVLSFFQQNNELVQYVNIWDASQFISRCHCRGEKVTQSEGGNKTVLDIEK